MALNETNSGVNQQQANSGQTQQKPMGGAIPGARAGVNKNDQYSIAGGLQMGVLGLNFSRGMTGAVLSQFMETAEAALEAKNSELSSKGIKVALIPFSGDSNPALGISAVVVASTIQGYDGVGAFHIIILEGSIEQVGSITRNVGNQAVQIKQFASDALREKFVSTVRQAVGAHFGNRRALSAESSIFPRNLESTDKEAVGNFLVNAIFADLTAIATSSPEFRDLSIAMLAKDSTLVIAPTFNNPNTIGINGQPIRTDIIVPLNSNPLSRDDTFARPTRISRLGAFVDLAYIKQASPMNFGGVQPVQALPTPVYAANLVITDIDVSQVMTEGSLELALATVMSVINRDSWIQAFQPNHVDKGLRLNDIGATGLDVNFENNPNGVGSPFKTDAATFTAATLYSFMKQYVEGISISMDVPECDTNTWAISVFAAAASGVQPAIGSILEAANQLTGGAFARHYNTQVPPVVQDENIILNGYYVDKAGRQVDIRQVDYLAVLNVAAAAGGDMSIVRDWANSVYNTGIDMAVRLADRARIIDNICGHNVTYTGRSRRVTFDPTFIDAFGKALAEAGLDLQVQGGEIDTGMIQRSAAGSNYRNTLVGGGNAGFLNRGGFGGAASGFAFGRNNWQGR